MLYPLLPTLLLDLRYFLGYNIKPSLPIEKVFFFGYNKSQKGALQYVKRCQAQNMFDVVPLLRLNTELVF